MKNGLPIRVHIFCLSPFCLRPLFKRTTLTRAFPTTFRGRRRPEEEEEEEVVVVVVV